MRDTNFLFFIHFKYIQERKNFYSKKGACKMNLKFKHCLAFYDETTKSTRRYYEKTASGNLSFSISYIQLILALKRNN